MYRFASGCLVLLALALCAAPMCSAQAIGMTQGVLLAQSGKSSLVAFPSPNTQSTHVVATMDACTGVQIHAHNGSELLMAGTGNNGPIIVTMIDQNNNPSTAQVQPGSLFAIPTGLIHFQYNPTCSIATFASTVPLYTDTQFTLAALSAIPATNAATFGSAGLPPASGAFAVDTTCMANCARRR